MTVIPQPDYKYLISVLENWYNILEDRVLTIERNQPEANVDRYLKELNIIMDQIAILAQMERVWNK